MCDNNTYVENHMTNETVLKDVCSDNKDHLESMDHCGRCVENDVRDELFEGEWC